FTGQTATGKEIMRAAVDGLKRVTLELGGKSPNIVFADADLEAAASGAFGGSEATIEGLEGGFFLEPTVLKGVRNDMKAAQEEIFGPVLAVIPWKDEDELIALANGSDYGLASGIWTSDVSKALRVAERLDAGTVWINTYGMFDVAVPFGGRRHSGFGKELGEEALEPYLHAKSVWVDLTAAVPPSRQGLSRSGRGTAMSDRIIIKNGTIVKMNDDDDVL